MVLARKSARGERRTPTLGYTGSAFLQHLKKSIKVLLNRSFLHGRRGDNSCLKNVLLTCRKESESCFVCLGCESSYYSMHGLHYHLNRTRYMKNKQGVEGKSPPKSCKKSTTFFRHFFYPKWHIYVFSILFWNLSPIQLDFPNARTEKKTELQPTRAAGPYYSLFNVWLSVIFCCWNLK